MPPFSVVVTVVHADAIAVRVSVLDGVPEHQGIRAGPSHVPGGLPPGVDPDAHDRLAFHHDLSVERDRELYGLLQTVGIPRGRSRNYADASHARFVIHNGDIASIVTPRIVQVFNYAGRREPHDERFFTFQSVVLVRVDGSFHAIGEALGFGASLPDPIQTREIRLAGGVPVGMPPPSEVVLLVAVQVRPHQVHLYRVSLFNVRPGTVHVNLGIGSVVVVG